MVLSVILSLVSLIATIILYGFAFIVVVGIFFGMLGGLWVGLPWLAARL